MAITVEIEIGHSGKSWVTQYIQELQDCGVSIARIAEVMGISDRMVCYLKATGTEPRYTPGEKLRAYHARVCVD